MNTGTGYAVSDSEVSYAQFRALANSIPNLAWMAHPDGWIFWYNRRWYDYTGTTPEQMAGWGWQAVHHPDVLPEMLRRWMAALADGKPFEMTFPLRRGSDGSYRIFVTRAEPLYEGGRLVGWFGTNTDVTEQERTRERLQAMINELNHRVKNTLATVHSIASHSFRNSNREAFEAFEGRLLALAGVHDMLTRESWANAGLDELIRVAIGPFSPERFRLTGEPVIVEPRVASALAITLHELATNATRFGSLSAAGGGVEISWRGVLGPGGARLLTIDWDEYGGPPAEPPEREGFGLRLIRRAAAVDRDASVSVSFEPAGLHCRIVLPIGDQVLR
ncbi:MAG: HWE histidine kinase domain-containing protein [Sphingomonadaceae bacterium]|nr:HWE histidine kinase domain-containing protein [Sphingomonadaceae bacterium]